MNEQKHNGRGIFYGVIGVATLVVAIIGATFAYFTASQNIANAVTGNMATITFDLAIDKVTTADEAMGGMIPMSNTMVEAAVKGTNKTDVNVGAESNPADPQICVDDNGNAVCQIYKISVVNGGTAGMYLDGYVTLTGGSGQPTDVTTWTNAKGEGVVPTTMRWAQVFCTGTDNKLTSCTTAGKTTTGTNSTGDGLNAEWATINSTTDTTGFNKTQITLTTEGFAGVTTKGTFAGGSTQYDIINKNYIRVSDRAADATGYNRNTDVTSALVYNQFIAPKAQTDKATIAVTTDSAETMTDAQVYYIVVWLSETGTNQTAGATGSDNTALPGVPSATSNFFSGNVTFVSAQGSEVTATFSSYTAVKSDNAVDAGQQNGQQ